MYTQGQRLGRNVIHLFGVYSMPLSLWSRKRKIIYDKQLVAGWASSGSLWWSTQKKTKKVSLIVAEKTLYTVFASVHVALYTY